jgi:glycosyltransferase involved in cell wall biosynthesis
MSDLRILIVAEHASARFGGEAILPLHYFRLLRRRGIEAWLIVHARTQEELSALLPEEKGRIFYIPDTWVHRFLYQISKPFPGTIRYNTFEFVMRLLTQWLSRRIARNLVREQHIDVIHQPIPVSPKYSSLLRDMRAPVIIGPMNGGMIYPEAFRNFEGRAVRGFVRVGRWASRFINLLMPGKLRAETLLVANERTRKALPEGVRGQVIDLVENGVDLTLWKPVERQTVEGEPIRFGFSGRLVDWKAVDLLLEAFAGVVADHRATLDIIGSGPEQPRLEAMATSLNIKHKVTFHGWRTQPEAARLLRSLDVFILPSLHECGGAVVLEAMATGLPVIATDWGGPTDYIDSTCGILVQPTSRPEFIAGLTRAMKEVAASPERRKELGRAGRERAVKEFDWERKIDRILEVYADTNVRFRSIHTTRPARWFSGPIGPGEIAAPPSAAARHTGTAVR